MVEEYQIGSGDSRFKRDMAEMALALRRSSAIGSCMEGEGTWDMSFMLDETKKYINRIIPMRFRITAINAKLCLAEGRVVFTIRVFDADTNQAKVIVLDKPAKEIMGMPINKVLQLLADAFISLFHQQVWIQAPEQKQIEGPNADIPA